MIPTLTSLISFRKKKGHDHSVFIVNGDKRTLWLAGLQKAEGKLSTAHSCIKSLSKWCNTCEENREHKEVVTLAKGMLEFLLRGMIPRTLQCNDAGDNRHRSFIQGNSLMRQTIENE